MVVVVVVVVMMVGNTAAFAVLDFLTAVSSTETVRYCKCIELRECGIARHGGGCERRAHDA